MSAEDFKVKAENLKRRHNKSFNLFKTLLKQYDIRLTLLPNAPLCTFRRDDTKSLVVFSNIPHNAAEIQKLIEDLSASIDKFKRIETAARAVTYATRKEETTIGKYLLKYSNVSAFGYDNESLRTLSESIAIGAAEQEIIICEKPEDYYEMFRVKTGGCMQVGTNYNEFYRDAWPKIADATGIYPSAWYHYTGYQKGAYIVIGGIPLARCMLYKDEAGNFTYFADVKGQSANIVTRFSTILTSKGYKRYNKYAETRGEYRVPGIFHELLNGGKTAHCPLPNCDNHRKDFVVAYDKGRNEFVFNHESTGKGTKVISTYDWKGYIDSSKIKEYTNGN